MKKSFLVAVSFLTLFNTAQAQTCSTSAGINLTQGSGSFAKLPARDQGQLGTCYAHSASDLLSAHLKIPRLNIYQTAIANDTAMDGGTPKDVIDSFGKIGWACSNTSVFSSMFPTANKNIISELQDSFVGTPIFYTVNSFDTKGISRQKQIAQKAAEIAKNSAISRGVNGILHKKNDLDSLPLNDAAEIVHHLIKAQHTKIKSIMTKYGVGQYTPTLANFIVDRVHYDQKAMYSYAGIMYPFKLIKEIMGKTCPQSQKVAIPSNVVGMGLKMRQSNKTAMQDKIESLLEKNRQAVSVSFLVSLLTGVSDGYHAVNIVGCRTNGNNTEYLLQNSWGKSCQHYRSSLRSKCSEGRIWINSDALLSVTTEINWVGKK